MKILTAEQIRKADHDTLLHDAITSAELMERAGRKCFEALIRLYSPRPVAVFTGKGNNGGDGLVIARLLAEHQYPVSVYMSCEPDELLMDAHIQFDKIMVKTPEIMHYGAIKSGQFPRLASETLVVDAILGYGINKPAQGLLAEIIEGINRSGCEVVSIDLPSGLPCTHDDFQPSTIIVKANRTLTLQQPKLTLLLSDFYPFFGEFELIDINLFTGKIPGEDIQHYFLTADEVRPFLKTRKTFFHKGNLGHALLIAGSEGKAGAAILSAEACLRTGAGMLSVHTARCCQPVLLSKVPEAMCTPCRQRVEIAGIPGLEPFQAVGMGPGIGTSDEAGRSLFRLLQQVKVPLILDADAINLLGKNKEWLDLLPGETILTPHPKEFDRITSPSESASERLEKQRNLSMDKGIIVVLKGAYSSISLPDGTIYFNSTGNPGMATAGSGDVLTGIILSLLTQGYPAAQAAMVGVFLHGLSGDLAAIKTGQDALLARDLIGHLKEAILQLRG